MAIQKRTGYVIIAIIGIGVVGTATAISSTCTQWCFSLVNHPDTKGYDPQFLAQPAVKQACIDSHRDLQKIGIPDLGFCSKELGTLP